MVEAIATAWALEFSLEVGINQGILQGDSKVVMKSLADEAQLLASFVLLLMAYLDWGGGMGYIYIYIYIYRHTCIWSILPSVLYS